MPKTILILAQNPAGLERFEEHIARRVQALWPEVEFEVVLRFASAAQTPDRLVMHMLEDALLETRARGAPLGGYATMQSFEHPEQAGQNIATVLVVVVDDAGPARLDLLALGGVPSQIEEKLVGLRERLQKDFIGKAPERPPKRLEEVAKLAGIIAGIYGDTTANDLY